MALTIPSIDRILLTGAGFTKNFGGFLAKEMWDQIFNNPKIQASQALRKQLMGNFDFESAYSEIVGNPSVPDIDKQRMRDAVLDAYTRLDDAVRGWTSNNSSPYPVHWGGLVKLLMHFNQTGAKKGFIFTLNQDLFMERQSNWGSAGAPLFPSGWENGPMNENKFVRLETADIEGRVARAINDHAGVAYIKLHGSFGWKSSDGSNQLVIGKNKTKINR